VKRGAFSEKEVRLVKSVEQEFELFKYKMLSSSRKHIFHSCNEIRFYSCIYEFFEYSETIEDEHIRACLNCGGYIIAALYRIYLDLEYLRYDCWEDIEEILNVLVREQEKYGLPEKQDNSQ
jgi:hypothetical protein